MVSLNDKMQTAQKVAAKAGVNLLMPLESKLYGANLYTNDGLILNLCRVI